MTGHLLARSAADHPFSGFFDSPLMGHPLSLMAPFSASASRAHVPGFHHGQRYMPVDVKETDKNIEVRADIPGVKKEDITVDIEKNILTLSVNQQQEKDEDQEDAEAGVTWHHSERSSMFVKRSMNLPETADAAAACATYTDGVLAITFPKKAAIEPKTKLTIK